MSGIVREENIRLRITALSELDTVAAQMAELIKLTRQQQEITQQSALAARTGAIQQVDAIQGITDALAKQKKQQKETDDETRKGNDDAAAARKKSADDISALGSQIRSFTTLVAAAFAISEIKSFGSDVIDAKTKIDSLKIALDVMLGSKKESATLYAQIVDLAKKTPFTLEEVADNVVKLKAYNIATAELIPTLNALGNIAAAVGKDKLPQLTLAYGQVINMGRLMGGETKQFIEAGVPLYDLLADSMKKPKEEVIKLAQEHRIMAADVKKAIMETAEVGGKYYDMMVLQSKTLGGQVSNLSDAYFTAKARVGDFFEKTLADGIGMLSRLTNATLGSNSAITRTMDVVKSVTAAVVAYTVAMNAQSVIDGISAAYQKAKTIAYGEYLIALRAAKTEQIAFTAAETEAVVVAETFNATLKANWFGVAATAIIALISAVYAYKAATDEVVNSLGEEELKLKSQQSELNSLTQAAMRAGQGTDERRKAIEQLVQKYPEYFKGLNTETATNNQLRGILESVNDSYRDRITLAREAYKLDGANEKQQAVFKAEVELFERVAKANVLNEEVVKSFGGSAQKLSDYLKANTKDAQALNQSWQGVGNAFKESIGNVADSLVKQQAAISKSVVESNKTITETNAQRLADDTKTENLRWANQVVNLKKGSDEYAAALKSHNDALAKIDGTYHEAAVKAVTATAEKTKEVMLVSAKEIALIKGQGAAADEVDRTKQLKAQLDFLDKEEAAEIESINKIKVNRKISGAALAALQEEARQKIMAIDAKYDLQRAAIQEQLESETQKNFLLKIQESNDKVAVLTAKRLEAEKMLTLLTDASTNTERLAALKVYQEKYKDSMNLAAVEQLKLQADTSRKVLDDVIARDGEKGDAYRKSYAAWLKDNETYNTALTKQAVDSAATTAKSIEKYETEIQAAKKETAKIEKDTLEQSKQNREQMLAGLANLIGKENSFMGEIAGGLVALYNGIDGLQLKALSSAKSSLSTAQDSLAVIKGMFSESTVEGAAAIAKGNEDVAKAAGKVEEAKGITAEAALGIAGTLYQVFSAIAAAYNESQRAMNQAIADSLGKVREAYKSMYDYIAQASAESHKTEMDNFNGSIDEKLRRINEYYAQEKIFVEGRDRIDAQLAYNQQMAQLQADAGTDAKKIIEGLIQAKADQVAREGQMAVDAANNEKAQALEVYNAKAAALDAEVAAYTAAKNAEIAKLNETLAIQKAAEAQYSSDDQLRLQNDDIYRQGLLAQGEAREVAFLEAAKQREIVRAQESGASAEEVARIITAFDLLIKDKHAEYETAKGDKSKEVSLAITEVKAQETDKVNGLEKASKDAITVLQNQIRTQEVQAAMEKTKAYLTYANAVKKAEAEIFEAQKAVIIAQLQAQVAILNAQKSWTGIGNGKINDAIDQINNSIAAIMGTGVGQNQTSTDVGGLFSNIIGGSIAQNLAGYQFAARVSDGSAVVDARDSKGNPALVTYNAGAGVKTVYDSNGAPYEIIYGDVYIPATGERYFQGTPYLELGENPKGRDTIPVMAHEGERIIPTADNLAIGGRALTNQELVSKIKFFDRLAIDFPHLVTPSGNYAQMRLPAGIMNSAGGTTLDMSGLRDEMRSVKRAIEAKKLVGIHVDQHGFYTSVEGQQSKSTYYASLQQQ